MNNILTFNELKEIAKKIAMDDDRVEKLYIEQLETQSMSSDANFFNVLYLVKDLSFDDTSFASSELVAVVSIAVSSAGVVVASTADSA